MNSKIYFDHASTSYPKPQEVLEGIGHYFTEIGASPNRGEYSLAYEAEAIVSQTRERLAQELGIAQPDQLFFTHNATHALNIILKGFLKQGDHVLITNFEHNSVVRPLYKLTQQRGVSYSIFSSDLQGHFDLKSLESHFLPNTKLIVANHASNVLGVISPIEEINKITKKKGIPILVDVSQTAGTLPIHVKEQDFDFVAGTGHKGLLGPSGVGYFFAKDPDLIDTLYEGGGANSASKMHPESFPAKFEAGTANYLGIAGLNASLGYIQKQGRANLYKAALDLTLYAIERLKKIPGLTIYGTRKPEEKVPLISINAQGFYPGELMYLFDEQGVCVRGGLQCAPLMHQTLKTLPQGTLRMSFGHRNTAQEVDRAVDVLEEILSASKNR